MEELAELIKRYRELLLTVTPDRGHVELEARFGYASLPRGRFASSTSLAMYEQACNVVQNFDNTGELPVTEHHDTCFRVKGVRYRTRTVFDADDMNSLPSTIHKQCIEYMVFRCTSPLSPRLCYKHGEKDDNPPPLLLKVQMSIEWKTRDEIPFFVNTESMRIVQRKSMCINDWTYDLALVWQGSNRQHAEHLRHTEAPNYEVEIELSGAERYMSTRTDTHVARAIFMRASDLVGCPSTSWVKV